MRADASDVLSPAVLAKLCGGLQAARRKQSEADAAATRRDAELDGSPLIEPKRRQTRSMSDERLRRAARPILSTTSWMT